MTQAIGILFKSLVDFFHPRSLLIFFLPFFLSALLWGGILFFLYDQMVLVADQLFQWLSGFFSSGLGETAETGFFSVISILVLALVLPVFWITQILLSSVLAFPLVIRHVRREYYPEILAQSKVSQFHLLAETLKVSLKYGLLCLVTLPLVVVVPILAVLFWAFMAAWMFAGVYLQEVLAEVADSEEEAGLIRAEIQDQVRMGVLASSLMTSFVPGFFIISPVYSALVVCHLGLAGLRNHRKNRN